MTTGKRRRQIFADRKIQGTLLAHTAIYWFYCLFSVTLIAVCWIIFTKQPESSAELFTQLWLNCGPALLGSVLLLPLVLLDCLRLSSRFAGPMVRMQRVMRELAAGQTPPAFALRPGDYWTEFAENLNTVMERLRQQDPRTQTKQRPASELPGVETSESPLDLAELDFDSPFAPTVVTPLDGESTTESIYSDSSI
ncbi:MAG: hypothetical protein O3C40_05405 [Planctomycetota bacterium]|nr:hypothetical protein [Planctomycetota bacterium]